MRCGGCMPHLGHFTLSGTRAELQVELPPALRFGDAARDVLLPLSLERANEQNDR